ncbi:MAG: DNA/RNA non-specific endonuclease [Bacteroidales bacterium]|nr:DNA/RNA non-specific endonuclease [Bacteroidales bacterium]
MAQKKYTKSSQKKTSQKKTETKKSKSSRFIYIGVLVILFIIYLIDPSILGIDKNYKAIETDGFHVNNITDGFARLPEGVDYETFDHTYYSYAYCPKYKDSYWVSYILTKKMVKTVTADRDDEQFVRDPQQGEDYAITSDYTNSDYDRGHMCPAGDMNFNQTAMTETFYLTNISPQKPGLNRGIWKELEEQVRDWAVKNDSLYIVAGAIFSQNPKKIGENNVAVPSKFYKVVADISAKDGYKAIAFVFDNKDYPDDAEFMDYAITVNELEEMTGIDFFANFQNEDVELIESTLNKNHWK